MQCALAPYISTQVLSRGVALPAPVQLCACMSLGCYMHDNVCAHSSMHSNRVLHQKSMGVPRAAFAARSCKTSRRTRTRASASLLQSSRRRSAPSPTTSRWFDLSLLHCKGVQSQLQAAVCRGWIRCSVYTCCVSMWQLQPLQQLQQPCGPCPPTSLSCTIPRRLSHTVMQQSLGRVVIAGPSGKLLLAQCMAPGGAAVCSHHQTRCSCVTDPMSPGLPLQKNFGRPVEWQLVQEYPWSAPQLRKVEQQQ